MNVIVAADFGGFREVKHPLIFSLYRFEFHTKILIFVFEMSNFVLTKQHLREILIFCFNWKKSAAEAIECLSKFMVTLLQLINHLGNGFDVSRLEISALTSEDKPRPGQPKKFDDKELEALLEKESNARGTCRIIGDNSISRFCTIESHGNDSKTRKLSAL